MEVSWRVVVEHHDALGDVNINRRCIQEEGDDERDDDNDEMWCLFVYSERQH